MFTLPLVPVQSVAQVFILSLALTLLCTAIPWLTRSLPSRGLVIVLIIALVLGVTTSIVEAMHSLHLTPVTNLMVLVVAWSGGVLLGREMPARFTPFLLMFVCLSALDVFLALSGYPQSPKAVGGVSPLAAANFVLMLPWGRVAINVADLLLLTAIAEHWRRRGGSYLLALLPGVLAFLLADGVVLATGLGQLPGFPFFTVGYLVSEAIFRRVSHPTRAPVA